MKTSTVYEMLADEYNKKLSEILKTMPEFNPPEWSYFVKSGTSRTRPPENSDFWYKRAASILRQIYINKVVGVNRLKVRYGGRKKRGVKPEHFYRGSGKIIRVILQQSEKAGLLEKYNERAKRAGRRLTKQGIKFLEEIR
jgi:small subunit ribosomal protein S19e